ncbi:MAG: hypothetical protein QOH53_546, partial [Ilumatobacteraceae bacterium]
ADMLERFVTAVDEFVAEQAKPLANA